jgi:hydroxyethylthiazole kinase-like uncharacterized protein yjeF
MGAAIISAKSALRAGTGLVTVNVPKKERTSIFVAVPEAMVTFREDKIKWEKYTTIAIGPGLGSDRAALKMVTGLLENQNKPVVFDADALTALATNQSWLKKLPFKSILTPHSKEFDRLFGNHTSESERRQAAIANATLYDCIVVLKGHQTFVTDGTSSFQNTTGNSGLAKGGSGDALTGIITAFLAQGYEPINAAVLGVYLHGLAADITLTSQSSESMLITDVIKNLGQAFYQLQP